MNLHDDRDGAELGLVGREPSSVRSSIRAARKGNREALGRVVELFQRRLFGLTLMMVRDPSGAEEVTQDAFVRAFARLDLYDERRPFYPWLATIAVRLAQNWLRQNSRTTIREVRVIDPQCEAAVTADPLAELITGERNRHLWKSVAALPSAQRTVVFLYYRQEMPVNEIGAALGVTGGTIKTLLFRARRRLQRTLDRVSGAKHPREAP